MGCEGGRTRFLLVKQSLGLFTPRCGADGFWSNDSVHVHRQTELAACVWILLKWVVRRWRNTKMEICSGLQLAWGLTRWEISLQVHHWRGRRLMWGAVGRWVTRRGALLQPGVSSGTAYLRVALWTCINWRAGFSVSDAFVGYRRHGLWSSSIRPHLVCFSCSGKRTRSFNSAH